ncbi:MAG: hypothetical protein JWR10_4181 [Rubritepida sp.]|nr:hypothetical protein [Rubritepida sp.]
MLFAALIDAPPRAALPEAEMAPLIHRLAASIRESTAILREASAGLSASHGVARLPELLARAEAAAQDQAECARALLRGLSATARHKAAA